MNPGKKEVINQKDGLLRKLVLSKLNSVGKEKFEPKAIDSFSLTFRVFLLRYLNLNYEFTLEELINELNKQKIHSNLKKKITSIMNLLTEIEYENKTISKEEFKSLLNESKHVVNLATGETETKETEKKGEEETRLKKRLLFNFLHKIGLIKIEAEKKTLKKKKEKTEKEKQKLETQKKEEKLRAKEKAKEEEKEKKKQEEEKRKARELEAKRREEERIEKAKIKEKLRKERRKARKKKIFKFLHDLGLAKAKEEKEQVQKQKEEERKESEKKQLEEESEKRIKERQRLLDEKRLEEEKTKRRLKEEGNTRELEEKGQKEHTRQYVECHKLLLNVDIALQNNDIPRAKKLFLKARDLYTKLEYSEKKTLYDDIKIKKVYDALSRL